MHKIAKIVSLAAAMALVACTGTQVDRADPSLFAGKNYDSYQWKFDPVMMAPSGDDSTMQFGNIFQEEVDIALREKGYRRVESGGDFLVSVQFRTTFEDGAMPGNNEALVPRMIANREPDQATVDNAVAMSGPRQMNNALLQFDAADDGSLLWLAKMSRLVENVNPTSVDLNDVRRNARRAIQRAVEPLPNVER
jgi:hypothetical protein